MFPMSGYSDIRGITARADFALLKIERIISDTSVPSAERLVLVAQVMAAEPILTDRCPAAYSARRNVTARHQKKGA